MNNYYLAKINIPHPKNGLEYDSTVVKKYCFTGLMFSFHILCIWRVRTNYVVAPPPLFRSKTNELRNETYSWRTRPAQSRRVVVTRGRFHVRLPAAHRCIARTTEWRTLLQLMCYSCVKNEGQRWRISGHSGRLETLWRADKETRKWKLEGKGHGI